MVVRLLVPRRADGGHRDRLWDYCRGWWESCRLGWEIRTGDHTDGPFNRSAAINRAAEGQWDVAVILDSDSLCEPEQLERAVERAATGRLALAYDTRVLLSRDGTNRILDGRVFRWETAAQGIQGPRDGYRYISGAIAVPRALWDRVAGFDQRFVGWGGEDDAFFAACTAVSGHDARTDPVPGDLWHLWHQPSPDTKPGPNYRMASLLAARYVRSAEQVLAESRAPDQIVVCCPTTGKRDTLEQALDSAEANLSGPIGRRVILVDRPSSRISRPGWDVEPMGLSRGYAVAMGRAVEQAVGSGQPWIFWLEDDFTFNAPVDLAQMQATMTEYPDLAQLVLLRQPWYQPELEAGSLLADPRYDFASRDGHVVHRNYWSMNPMLTRREVLARYQWPTMPGSESRFGRRILADQQTNVAFWGGLDSKPAVTHIGQTPAGVRY